MSTNPPDPPKGPDYNTVSNQQTTANTTAGVQSQSGSMPNQTNQYGSVTHEITGYDPVTGVPQYGINTKLDPTQQYLFNTLMGTKGVAGQQGQQLLAGANYGARQPTDVIGGMTSGITKDMLDKQVGFLQPFQQTEVDQLDTKLRNQGLFPGQPGYEVAMRRLNTDHSQAVQDFLSKAEPQAFQQASTMYGMPLSMSSALAGFGAPGDPTQNLVNTPALNIQPANIIGASANQGDLAMKQYAAEQAKYSNMMSGLMGIPTAVLGGWAKGGFPGMSSLTSLV